MLVYAINPWQYMYVTWLNQCKNLKTEFNLILQIKGTVARQSNRFKDLALTIIIIKMKSLMENITLKHVCIVQYNNLKEIW